MLIAQRLVSTEYSVLNILYSSVFIFENIIVSLSNRVIIILFQAEKSCVHLDWSTQNSVTGEQQNKSKRWKRLLLIEWHMTHDDSLDSFISYVSHSTQHLLISAIQLTLFQFWELINKQLDKSSFAIPRPIKFQRNSSKNIINQSSIGSVLNCTRNWI